MLFAGGKKKRSLSTFIMAVAILMVVLMTFLCKAEAIRSYPYSRSTRMIFSMANYDNAEEEEKEDLFSKYFNVSSSQFNGAVVEESKRKVPSCPDPLHN